MSEYDVAAAAVVRAGQRLVAAGLVVGSGGNISARLGDRLLVTSAGAWLDELDPVGLTLVGAEGTHLDGPPPTSELALHVAAYAARPRIGAVVHAHPQSVLLLSALERLPVLATTDHAHYVRSVGAVGLHPPGSDQLAQAAAEALAAHEVVVLARHGISAVGDDVEVSVRRALNVEEAARLTLGALALGRELTPLPPGPWH